MSKMCIVDRKKKRLYKQKRRFRHGFVVNNKKNVYAKPKKKNRGVRIRSRKQIPFHNRQTRKFICIRWSLYKRIEGANQRLKIIVHGNIISCNMLSID